MKIAIPVWKSGDGLRYAINSAYIEYVQGAGYSPVVIVPENEETALDCDGLLLPGGIDIDPIYYNEDNFGSYNTDFEKDAFERRLLNDFVEMGKPVFGICRGFQLIAREFLLMYPKAEQFVVFFQHVNDHNGPGSYKIKRSQPLHYIDTDSALWTPGTSKIVSQPVNSMHHQALILLDTSNKFKIIEKAMYVAAVTQYGLNSQMIKDKHCVVEAFTLQLAQSNIVAVQWHPEEMKDYALLHGCFGSKETLRKVKKKKG